MYAPCGSFQPMSDTVLPSIDSPTRYGSVGVFAPPLTNAKDQYGSSITTAPVTFDAPSHGSGQFAGSSIGETPPSSPAASAVPPSALVTGQFRQPASASKM